MISTIEEASNKIINMDNDIKETYERTIALLDSMPNGLILLDSKRNILLRNKAIEKFYYSIKEQGKDNILLDLKSKIEECLNQKQSISFDWNVQNIIYSISIEALGEKGTAILVYDVTNQRRIEDTKRDFMVYASHQMKTPLTSVIGYLEMIIDGVVTDEKEVREMTNDALTSAKTLNGMLKDMLSLAKMESNVPLNREKIDLAEMTSVVCNSFKEQCLVKKINIIKDLQTLYVEMERRDCERLLANLIENGIKYNKEYGSVVIIIDPYKNQLIVKDSGVGIPQNDLSRIFERFYRGSGEKRIFRRISAVQSVRDTQSMPSALNVDLRRNLSLSDRTAEKRPRRSAFTTFFGAGFHFCGWEARLVAVVRKFSEMSKIPAKIYEKPSKPS